MNKTKKMAVICIVAAVYTALSLVLAPITYGNIQCRIAEALNLLPIIMPISAWGVILGCFLTNLIGAMQGINILGFMDCIVGTLATVIAVWLVIKFKNVKIKDVPWLSMLMPVTTNGVIIGLELAYVIFPDNFAFGALISGVEVALGEAASMILGYFLIKALAKTKLSENH